MGAVDALLCAYAVMDKEAEMTHRERMLRMVTCVAFARACFYRGAYSQLHT